MTDKQQEILCRLTNALYDVNEECINDPEFNELIASLGCFNKSLDEIESDIWHIINKQGSRRP
ncbi:MAG: hypothetical protein ACOYJ1_05530 [Peptococcales bacterium]